MSDAFSINRLYELTGVDRRTIKKRLTAASVLPNEDGCYPSAVALKAIYVGDSKKKTPDILESESRIFAANARTAEVKASKAEGQVVPVADVDMALGEFTVLLAQNIQLIVPKFRSRHSDGMSTDQSAEIIEQMISDILNDISKPITFERSENAEGDPEPGVEESGAET